MLIRVFSFVAAPPSYIEAIKMLPLSRFENETSVAPPPVIATPPPPPPAPVASSEIAVQRTAVS